MESTTSSFQGYTAQSALPKELMAEKLYHEFKDVIGAYDSMALVSEDKSKNQVIRSRTFDATIGIEQFVLKRRELGIVPSEFVKLLVDIRNFLQVNSKRILKYDVLHEEEFATGLRIQTYANISKQIAIISGRLSLDTRYYFPKDNLLVTSSRDNDDVRQEYRLSHKDDTSSLTDSLVVIAGFHFIPILDKDDETKIIGTDITMMLTQDIGGLIPKWVTKKVVPTVLGELADDFVAVVRRGESTKY